MKHYINFRNGKAVGLSEETSVETQRKKHSEVQTIVATVGLEGQQVEIDEDLARELKDPDSKLTYKDIVVDKGKAKKR